jgi:hypothetical protein
VSRCRGEAATGGGSLGGGAVVVDGGGRVKTGLLLPPPPQAVNCSRARAAQAVPARKWRIMVRSPFVSVVVADSQAGRRP